MEIFLPTGNVLLPIQREIEQPLDTGGINGLFDERGHHWPGYGCVEIRHSGKIRGPTPTANTMAKTKQTLCKTVPAGTGKALQRLHYPLDVILLCVRWHVAFPLSLRDLEEIMAERGVDVDHSTVHRWAIKLVPS